jgi:nucleoside-diphosphate-sugar epimerase
MTRVSITGATGFVGWHAAEALRDRGWSVRAIVRPGSRKPLPERLARVQAALTTDALTEAFTGSDAVVHCAGLTRAPSQQALQQVNVDGTRAVVEAANRTGSRVVLISSLAAGGIGTVMHPRRESDPSEPVNAYGRSKLAGEQVARHHSRTAFCILRPGPVYGPRDRGFLPLFQMAKRGLFLLATDSSMPFTMIAIGDLARAIVLAAEREQAAGETCFLGHPSPRTTADILQTIARAVDCAYRPRRVPQALLRLAANVGEVAWKLGIEPPVDRSRLAEFTAPGFVCSVTRAQEVLGFTASTTLEEGIPRVAKWYREHGWL